MMESANARPSNTVGSELGLMVCDVCLALVAVADFAEHVAACANKWECSDCGKTMPRSEKDAHLATHTQSRCDACGDSVEAGGAAAHSAVCLMRSKMCTWCGIKVSLLEHHSHESICECRKRACDRCGAWVMMSQMDRHLSSGCQYPTPKPPTPQPAIAAGPARDATAPAPASATASTATTDADADVAVAADNDGHADADSAVPGGVFSLTSMETEADEQATAAADHSTSDGQIGSAADGWSCMGESCTDAAPCGRGRFSTMRCDICHELVPADLFDDHRHICAAMQTDRPFTGGNPLPAVGRSSRSGSASSLSSRDRSDAPSPAHVGPKRRPRPPPRRPGESGNASPRTIKHKALFGRLSVSKDAPIAALKKNNTNTTFRLPPESKARRKTPTSPKPGPESEFGVFGLAGVSIGDLSTK